MTAPPDEPTDDDLANSAEFKAAIFAGLVGELMADKENAVNAYIFTPEPSSSSVAPADAEGSNPAQAFADVIALALRRPKSFTVPPHGPQAA